ncbi:nucleotide exchange factor GrpE [Actinacidiphila acidipaludis]|uniref:Protein GrpE n=1 Tax=Actinacidiphila acidipaludis TaxID=2873382 RepID=A0ABS7QC06_9ACTN|nr:nucleotide exchange factor GrpE [Streptomyces acidipaludis]MBY8880715.1 nucleotide exchange factor GrpE [Streptomyces acidipaludis]
MSDQEQSRSAEDRPPPEPDQTSSERTPGPQDPSTAPETGEHGRSQGTGNLEAEELEDRWRRALADVDNLRKRYARELPREREAERSKVAAAFLPVVDNLELALAHAGADDPGAIVSGVRAVRDQAVEVLRSLGYPRHEETGVPFDPEQHEVVSVVDEPDTAPGTVVRVLRPGYGEAGRQLRPAAVAVSRKQE